MCGITGYICNRGVRRSDIELMNLSIHHRGPDDSGIYISNNETVGFGHQRLSIIDLETGYSCSISIYENHGCCVTHGS